MTYRLPQAWKEIKLEKIVDFNVRNYSSNDNWKYVNYLDTGNLTQNVIEDISYLDLETDRLPSRARRKVMKGDILYSTVRPNQNHMGIIIRPYDNMLVSTGFAVMSPCLEKVCPIYIYYYLAQKKITDHLQAIAEQRVSAYPALNMEDLKQLIISLPPLPEQTAVASTLSALDNKIELNNKINDNLEAQTQALFKHWFVDFEFPDENGNPYKSSGGTMVESEEGLIPKGWRIIELGDLCTRENLNVKFPQKGLFYHYSIPAYDSHKHALLENGLTIKSNKYHVDNNHVIFSRLNPIVKRLWRPICKGNNCICSTEFVVLKSKNDLNKGLLYSILDSQNFHNFCLENVTGATNSHQRVSPPGIILKYKLALPSAGSLEEFINYVNESHKIIDCNIIQNQILSQLRNTLLPKLMSGEIRIPLEQ